MWFPGSKGTLSVHGPFALSAVFVPEQKCSHLTLAVGHKHCPIAAVTVMEEPGAAVTCTGLPALATGAGQLPNLTAASCSAMVSS